MSNSAEETPKDSQSTTPVYIPPPSTEPLLVINVKEGANTDDIVAAVDAALRAINDPFFPYDTPLVADARARNRGGTYERKSMVPGEALMMLVRQEGW